jgi:Ser/Thr protein kinase RdoA (MazF antagonist)
VTSRRHPNHRPTTTLPPELRRASVPPAVRSWISRQLGSTVTRVRRLAGASSTAVHRVWLADGRPVVLRRYVWPGFLLDEPDAPVREVEALRFASAHGLPAPAVLAADPDGAAVGDGVAALVMTFVSGRAMAVPDLRRLAELAASIHAVDASTFPHAYFPWSRATMTGPPPGARDPRLWRAAIEAWHTRMPGYGPGLVHRDFHPGNVLWARSAVHVVDWANACSGPWGCDVAHCRDNLVRLAGTPAADEFLRHYLDVTGLSYDPYWEVASVLEHEPEKLGPADIARSEPRLRAALADM